MITISMDDPRLTESRRMWSPPSSWEESGCTPDERAWIEAMADLGLHSKACSAFECGDYYIPILVYGDHYVRLGRATCQCKTCRDCGTGKMRVHRIYKENPGRFAAITSESCRTFRLTIHHSTPSTSIADYMVRVWESRAALAMWRRNMQKEFGDDYGYTVTPEFDPRMRDVRWRVYYVGRDPGHQWFAGAWQRAVGLQAQCESKRRGPDQEAKDGLRWTMDAINDLLTLPGAMRAQWEAAMQGYRFTSSVGALRGVEVDAMPAVPDSGDPTAPYGRCPCGCGGALERPDTHTAAPRSYFDSHFRIVDTGAIKTYSAKNRAKVGVPYSDSSIPAAIAPSPPPW